MRERYAPKAASRRFRPAVDAVEPRMLLSTFTVTNTNDSGPGTLRRALVDSGNDPGPNTITFALPGPGPHLLRPSTPLPSARTPVTIDGYTEPGAAPNTSSTGDNARIAIVLDGSAISDPSRSLGLEVKADNSTVRGLSIVNFQGIGVLLQGNNDHLEGNFLGVDASGETAGANGLGAAVFGGGAVIGGTDPSARNVISANTAGVGLASLTLGGASLLAPAAGGTVQNNLIGTDATGTVAMGNAAVGVALVGSGNVVGGTAPGQANTIAYNGRTGAGVIVAGIQQAPDATIRVTSTGNLISGNALYGNRAVPIGLLDVPFATLMPLLNVSSSDLPSAVSGLLGGLNVGIAPNVHLRPASGPNNLENYPELTSAVTAGGATTVRGTLDSTPRTAFRVQFFASGDSDPNSYGQARTFLGETAVTTGAEGLATFAFTPTSPVPLGQSISAVAIDPSNNTSAFSAPAAVTPTAPPASAKPTVAPPAAPVAPPTAAAPGPDASSSESPRARRHPVVLLGMTKDLVIANHGGIARISGTGRLSKIGPIAVASRIDSNAQRPLLTTPWLLHADLTFTAPRGTIDVRVSPGTLGVDPFAQPVHLKYAVLGGTGAYRNAGGAGLVDLRLHQSIPKDASGLKAMGNQLKTSGIRFTLNFHPGNLRKIGDFSSVWYKVIRATAKKPTAHPPKRAAR